MTRLILPLMTRIHQYMLVIVVALVLVSAVFYREASLSTKREYHPDGTICRVTQLDYAGQPHGSQWLYTIDGKLYSKIEYLHGEAIYQTGYDPESGKVDFVWGETSSYQMQLKSE